MRSRPLLTRLAPKSYKREYITRFNLVRSYTRPTSAFSASLDSPGAVPIYMGANTVFLLYKTRGIVARYATDTGKIDKKRIMLVEEEGPVSAVAMVQHDMIVTGYLDGRVSLLAVNPRNYQNSALKYFEGRHAGEVVAVTMWKSVVVSGSLGEIRIWYEA
jgi:hypothetical protein